MPQYYTVPTSNPYAGLDSSESSDIDSDGDQRIHAHAPASSQNKQQQQQSSQQATTTSAVSKAPVARSQTDSPNNLGKRRGEKPQKFNNRRQDATQDAESANAPKAVVIRSQSEEEDGEQSKSQVRRAEPRRVRGSSRGGAARPRGTGFETVNREFDRHSGSGRGKENKKQGGGAHNWGNQEEDYGGETGGFKTFAGATDETGFNAATNEGVSNGAWDNEGPTTTTVKEEGDKTSPGTSSLYPSAQFSTLADYKKEMESVKAQMVSGADASGPVVYDEKALRSKLEKSGFVALEKEDDEDDEQADQMPQERNEPRTSRKNKVVVTLTDPGFEGRGRGRGGRGGRGGGGFRGNAGRSTNTTMMGNNHAMMSNAEQDAMLRQIPVEAPNLDDNNAFPSLSG